VEIINPATEEIITQIEVDDQNQIFHKFDLLQRGFIEWSNKSILERISCIRKFHQLLIDEIESSADILTNEVGKPLAQSRSEIIGASQRIQFFIEKSPQYLEDEWVHRSARLNEKISFEPLGIVANISAWNYPYLVGVNVFIPALIAGNAVFYKPSEYSLLTGLNIQKLLFKAGVSENVFQVARGGADVGELLLDLPLDGYFFTGSNATGQYIYRKVASKMVPCQLELGGKDPLYVAEHNKDLKKVAQAAADGVFYNNGQSCCAVERLYVHRNVYDHFLKEFLNEVDKIEMGDPKKPGVNLGPLTRPQQMDVLDLQVKDAISKGAQLLKGGHRVSGTGYFFQPAVLVDVNHSMSVMKDESFGPVIGIQKVENDQEAVELMKDTKYGLTASVYTDHQDIAEKILRAMDTGTVYWNCCDRVSARLPWSGRNHSGIGITLSHIGIRTFTQPKAYHLQNPK